MVAYPFALLVISLGVNLFLFGVQPLEPSLPTREIFVALTVAAAGLLANHSWLMTSTELTRSRFELYATPEEWTAAGKSRSQADQKGLEELERRHNTHRNATENTVYFAFLGVVFALVSPPAFAAFV
ncbi:MAPEG family protein [Roseibium sp.]|uniref:MAPEG family protein n=1 Tax=Roseibium sp. TaxID=1936156 RepID=UPI00344ACDFF